VIAKEPLFINKFKNIINNSGKIEFSKKYINILNLVQKLKELNEI
jgi:ribosomal protein S12 methylthiotransferase accessory factor